VDSLLHRTFDIYKRLPEPWHTFFKENFNVTRAETPEQFEQIRLAALTQAPPGFEEFANKAQPAWIAPANPASSVFYHALACPTVQPRGLTSTDYPDDNAIETVENYVFARARRSLADLREIAAGFPLAIAVFAKQYRMARETTHRKFADLVFSRIGVSRVGNDAPIYDGLLRCHSTRNLDHDKTDKTNVLPCRFSSYIAAKIKGNRDGSIPGRFRPGDEGYEYWVPLHKLFSGDECLRDFSNLAVALAHEHCNEKLRRIHRALGWLGVFSGYGEPEISSSPFVARSSSQERGPQKERLLQDFCLHGDGGSALVVPMAKIVEGVEDERGQLLAMHVPPATRNTDSSFHIFPRPLRWAPEFIYVRQELNGAGITDLNSAFDVSGEVRRGGYRAVHYRDFTCDGWIRAECAAIASQLPLTIPAYSVVAPPDLMPNLRQSDLMDWYENDAPDDIKSDLWDGSSPTPLCDQRITGNLELPGGTFSATDFTVPALVGFFSASASDQQRVTMAAYDILDRTTTLPDDASGIFAPGSEIGQNQTEAQVSETGDPIPPVPFLSNYGMGSPFLEDTKLCAAQSAFWPGTTPDTARVFEPHFDQPTVTPLLDSELAWDGSEAPSKVCDPKPDFPGKIRHRSRAHADYVKQLAPGEKPAEHKFDFTLLGRIDLAEYTQRTIAMARVYESLDVPIIVTKAAWVVFSCTRPEEVTLASDTSDGAAAPHATYPHPAQPGLGPLAGPQRLSGRAVEQAVSAASESTYRFLMYRHTGRFPDPERVGTFIVTFQEMLTIYANPRHVYIKRPDHWDHVQF
jgi:hypothetical protein